MNELILEELKKKNPELFSQMSSVNMDEARQEAARQKENIPAAQFAAGLGASLAGRDPSQSLKYFDSLKSNIDENTIGAAEKKNKEMLDFYLKQKLMEQQAEDSKLDREFKKTMMSDQMRERAAARQDRALLQKMREEEMSAAQAKQLGLAKIGNLANSQYEEAIRAGKENKKYDPTSTAEFIDNSDSWFIPNDFKSKEAVAAQTAQRSWVESYLRDASGAAIPESERLAYAKDYFPRPGDTPEVIANKEALRKQKEENALIGAGPGAKKFQQNNSFPKQIRKDGQVATVSNEEELKEAQAEGWK